MTEKIKKLFKKVRLFVTDVDGVLTNGEIIYDAEGTEYKIFNVRDGLGLFLLRRVGISTLLFTAKDSCVVRRRAKDFKADVIGGILPKGAVLHKIEKKYKVAAADICFVGDDVIDISIMKKVGIPVAVKNAVREVKSEALYVTKQEGGRGAVREVTELILKSQGLWGKALQGL